MMAYTFEYVDETVESDRSNECYQVIFSCGAVYRAVDEILNMDHSRASFKSMILQ